MYKETHPWLTFTITPSMFSTDTLLNIGEALSKCEHISGALLPPEKAKELYMVYLSKGIHGTTAIEGNTLTEEQVARRVDQNLGLSASLEYQGVEIDNQLELINEVIESGARQELTVELICDWNRRLLRGQPVASYVTPGVLRLDKVGVGRYLAPHPEDVPGLMDEFIEFVNNLVGSPDEWGRVMRVAAPIIAHLYFAWIHPFGDGNGRTARLIELFLLVRCGVPGVAAHVMSDFYNRTRGKYYQVLERASELPNREQGVGEFLDYAVRGFVDGLCEQVAVIEVAQFDIAWRSYVQEVFMKERGDVAKRRERLCLAVLDLFPDGVVRKELKLRTEYSGMDVRTFSRDVNWLVRRGLFLAVGDRVCVNRGLLRSYMHAA